MLAGLERQKEIGEKLSPFRHTFEEFVQAGNREKQPGFFSIPRYWWSRTQILSHNGQEVTLSVASTSDAPELCDAELRIEISADDGRKEQEFLPSLARSQKISPQEMLKTLDKLSDIEAVVRKFNQDHPPLQTASS